jgi:hypothetical protein
MKKKIISYILLFLTGSATAWSHDDWGTWNNYAFRLPLIEKKLMMRGAFQTRFRNDLDEFYYYHFQIGPEYRPVRWLTLCFLYWNVESGAPGDFHTEHRPTYIAIPAFSLADLGMDKWRLGPLALSIQNQLWERIRHYYKHHQTWRYSVFPRLSYPAIKTESICISPYTGNDFYFSLENGIGYNENRLYGGITVKIAKHTVLDFYYMRRADRPGRGGDWAWSNIIGTGILVDF